jgi:hypothetical protein
MSESVSCAGAKTWSRSLLGIPMRRLSFHQYAPFAIAVALAGGYAYLLAWFTRVDFYHHEFFVHGAAVTAYQIARLIFIPYFAWTIYCAGAFANILIFGLAAATNISSWERCPLFFITGAGIWHVVMFGIGLAGFDIKPVAVALSLGMMSFSVPHLAECLRESAQGISRLRFKLDIDFSVAALLWLGIFAVTAIFLLVKGLYPGGGHDYYNHYFQFYKRVIETGSILPNDVWYQFYYSSGAGLYFQAMLLTDPLAPQLVATGFIGCGAMVVYALLRTATRSALLPLIGVLFYIGVLIYTPGPRANMAEGGWGILEKVHEICAVLILGMIWIVYRSFRNKITALGPWMVALHSAVICIALLTLPVTLLVGVYLAGYVAWFAVMQQWCVAVRPFAAGVTATVALLGLGAINYHYTGFPSVELITQFWRHADLEQVMRWGTMLEILTQHRGASHRFDYTSPISWETVLLVATFLRFELWWPLFLGATPFVIYQLRSKTARVALSARTDTRAWSALTWFGAVVILVAVFGGGRAQPVSFYRLSTFSYAPTLCLALMFCRLGFSEAGGAKQAALANILTLGGMLAIGISAILVFSPGTASMVQKNLTAILVNARSLWNGEFSLKDAYQDQQGWSGTGTPYGAIYPGIIEPWRIAGPRERIWSFHIQSYCMLPDCNIQEFISERFSPSWQTVLFGPAEAGIQTLKDEGLNYFFFSTELGMGNDPLPVSPIFSPDKIAKHLAVRWTDGTSYLLTWPNDKTRPIDSKFLIAYSAAINANGTVRNLVAYHFKQISDYLTRHKHDLRPFFLPWCTTCQGMLQIDWANMKQSAKD